MTQSLGRAHDVLALTHSDLDITDQQAVEHCVRDTKPALIINCAVLQVDESEQDPVKAKAVNVDGPGFLAEAASQIGAEIVHFSTQYAFEGEPLGRPPYTITDAPAPVNVYGKTKLVGEETVHGACERSYIIRTSWVYGSGKNSFLCTVHNDLKNGKRVRAIDDIWSSTTYVEDLIDQVMTIRRNGFYGTYHVVNAGTCTYYEFALEAAKLLGLPRAQIDRADRNHPRTRHEARRQAAALHAVTLSSIGRARLAAHARLARSARGVRVRLGRVSSLESRVSRSCPPHYIPILHHSNRPRSD